VDMLRSENEEDIDKDGTDLCLICLQPTRQALSPCWWWEDTLSSHEGSRRMIVEFRELLHRQRLLPCGSRSGRVSKSLFSSLDVEKERPGRGARKTGRDDVVSHKIWCTQPRDL
jgi:hypothetical protein